MNLDFSKIVGQAPIDEENTELKEDGLLYCTICKEKKQKYIELFGKELKVNVLCKCEKDKLVKEKENKEVLKKNKEYKQRLKYISAGYRGVFLENSDIELIKEKNYIDKFPEMYSKNIGLMYFGTVGNGKTYRASVIANELCRNGRLVVMQHITEALQNITKFDNDYYIDLLHRAALLIIDDFGAERTTDYQIEALNRLIDIRYQTKKPLIVTTNIERSVLSSEQDIRLKRSYNRIIEMTHPILIKDKCRRIEIAKGRFNEIENMLRGAE